MSEQESRLDPDDIDAWFPEAAERQKASREAWLRHARKNMKPAERMSRALEPTPDKKWRCEDEIKTTLSAFAQEWPELIPRGSKSSLYAATRKLVTETGEQDGPAFVHWAADQIRRKHQGLTIKSPRSILFLMGDWRKRGADRCPECGKDWINCPHEWGASKRRERYIND